MRKSLRSRTTSREKETRQMCERELLELQSKYVVVKDLTI